MGRGCAAAAAAASTPTGTRHTWCTGTGDRHYGAGTRGAAAAQHRVLVCRGPGLVEVAAAVLGVVAAGGLRGRSNEVYCGMLITAFGCREQEDEVQGGLRRALPLQFQEKCAEA